MSLRLSQITPRQIATFLRNGATCYGDPKIAKILADAADAIEKAETEDAYDELKRTIETKE